MADWKKEGNIYKSDNHMDINKITRTVSKVKYTGPRAQNKVSAGEGSKTLYSTMDVNGNVKEFSTLSQAKKVSESFNKDDFLNTRARNYLNQKPESVSMKDYKEQIGGVLKNAGGWNDNELNDIFSRMDIISGVSSSRGTGSTGTSRT